MAFGYNMNKMQFKCSFRKPKKPRCTVLNSVERIAYVCKDYIFLED